MDARPGAEDEKGAAAREALERALDEYLAGAADLEASARRAGMDAFDFLQEAGSLPDPVAVDAGPDLPTFVRHRPGQHDR